MAKKQMDFTKILKLACCLLIYSFVLKIEANNGRSTPMLVDVCIRFPHFPYCAILANGKQDLEALARKRIMLPLPKEFLRKEGRPNVVECKRYELHYSYWCTTLSNDGDVPDRPDVEQFCDKFEGYCDTSQALTVAPKLTAQECAQYEDIARTYCYGQQTLAPDHQKLCDLYQRSCQGDDAGASATNKAIRKKRKRGGKNTKQQSSTSVAQLPLPPELAWVKNQNIALGASSRVENRIQLIENCTYFMNIYQSVCQTINKKKENNNNNNNNIRRDHIYVHVPRPSRNRRKRSVPSPLDLLTMDPTKINVEETCEKYKPMAEKACTGRNEDALTKKYCDYFRQFCKKSGRGNNQQGRKNVQQQSFPEQQRPTMEGQGLVPTMMGGGPPMIGGPPMTGGYPMMAGGQGLIYQPQVGSPMLLPYGAAAAAGTSPQDLMAWASLDADFCPNFSKLCNTLSVDQEMSRIQICQDYADTKGMFCPAYPLQQDRLGCAAFRKYCMNAPAFLNIDGIEW